MNLWCVTSGTGQRIYLPAKDENDALAAAEWYFQEWFNDYADRAELAEKVR